MVRVQCNAMPSLKLKLMNEEHNLEKLQKAYKIPVVLEVCLSFFLDANKVLPCLVVLFFLIFGRL